MKKTSIKSDYIYVQSNDFKLNYDPTKRLDSGKALVDACQSINWRDPKSGLFLAGWLALARIGGSLDIRPHIWITGGAGSGKSTVLHRLVRRVLGTTEEYFNVHGATTEAGIRQHVQSNAIPVVYDEAEQDSPEAAARIAKIVELARSAWDNTDSFIAKGTASGIGQWYRPYFSIVFSSIRVNLEKDADRSRISVLEINGKQNNQKSYKMFMEAINKIDDDYAVSLLTRCVDLIDVIRASHKVLKRCLETKISSRYGDQVGSLLAGYWSLEHELPISEVEAMGLISEIDLREDKQDAAMTDEQECLNHLMTSRIDLRRPIAGDTITTTIQAFINPEDGVIDTDHKGFADYGIRLDIDANRCTELRILEHYARINALYKGTRWEGCWTRSLARLPKAERSSMRLAPKQPGESAPPKCLVIPL